jgi:methylthioribose-1-phosphate isomerase
VDVTVIADNMAASRLRRGGIAAIVVGADRIAANGDTANKIGTYSAAIAARYHGVRFMVVAPTSTMDLATPDGSRIPIEQRGESEVLTAGGKRIAPAGAHAWNPAFDVTPAGLIDAIVTERGVVLKPDPEKIAALMRL